MELEKTFLSEISPESERQTWCVFVYIWILVVKAIITRLQSIATQRVVLE